MTVGVGRGCLVMALASEGFSTAQPWVGGVS